MLCRCLYKCVNNFWGIDPRVSILRKFCYQFSSSNCPYTKIYKWHWINGPHSGTMWLFVYTKGLSTAIFDWISRCIFYGWHWILPWICIEIGQQTIKYFGPTCDNKQFFYTCWKVQQPSAASSKSYVNI